MLALIKKIFIGMSSFEVPTRFDQARQPRPTIVNINSNEPLNYPFNVGVNKCGGSCNTMDGPYTLIFVPNKVKNINAKVFILM